MKCGESLSGVQKSVKGTQPKCRNCGHFNELDALFCIACGKEIIKASGKGHKEQLAGPSYKMITLVVGMVFLVGIVVKLGTTFFTGQTTSGMPSSSASVSNSVNVDETQVIAVAKNFKCACGGCGELPLATCECDMAKGAVEEKRFIREKLAEGFTVEQVIELLDKKYGYRV
jgi:cytochrome c-type biogenesis protein CcmH/NrfF